MVGLDLCGTTGTQTGLGVPVEQPREKIPSSRGDDFRTGEGERLLENLLVHHIGVFVIERRQTSQHLVKEDTQCPPVDGLGVAVANEQLRSKVLRSSTECYYTVRNDYFGDST